MSRPEDYGGRIVGSSRGDQLQTRSTCERRPSPWRTEIRPQDEEGPRACPSTLVTVRSYLSVRPSARIFIRSIFNIPVPHHGSCSDNPAHAHLYNCSVPGQQAWVTNFSMSLPLRTWFLSIVTIQPARCQTVLRYIHGTADGVNRREKWDFRLESRDLRFMFFSRSLAKQEGYVIIPPRACARFKLSP
jgi:hypothetical protein